MIRLLNTAMMPAEGAYTLVRLAREGFIAAMREAAQEGFCSYIGYPETARHIEALSGVHVPVSRDPTAVEDGDVLLICKLKYRVTDLGAKGSLERLKAETVRMGADAFEYFRCEYHRKEKRHD